jgi:hypothetical protein
MAQNPFDILSEASTGQVLSRCLNALAEVGIADSLGDMPLSSKDLAAATNTHAGPLGRMLRLLSAYAIFEARDGRYAHTPASRLLRKNHPQSLRSYVLMVNLPICWNGFEALGHTLRSGEPALDKAFPGGIWN